MGHHIVDIHSPGALAVDLDNRVGGAEPDPFGGRIGNGIGHHLRIFVIGIDADLDADAAELAARLLLKLLEVAHLIEIGIRVEVLEYALDRVLREVPRVGVLHIGVEHTLVHLREEFEPVVRTLDGRCHPRAAHLDDEEDETHKEGGDCHVQKEYFPLFSRIHAFPPAICAVFSAARSRDS